MRDSLDSDPFASASLHVPPPAARPPSLRGASERAAYEAIFALLDGGIAVRAEGEIELVTEEGRYRFIDGVCFDAPAPSDVGASLAGWLVESARASAVLTRWWRGARAVFAGQGATVRVTGPSVSLCVGGAPAAEGFTTHDGRLVLAHDPPEAGARDPGDVALAPSPAAAEVDVALEELDAPFARATRPDGPDSVRAAADEEDDRPTMPPSAAAEEALSQERRLARSAPPQPIAHPERRSYAAPPAWELPRFPRFGPLPPLAFDLADALEEEAGPPQSTGDRRSRA